MLEYTPNAETDYGTLACWASNSIGRQRTPCIFNIVPASKSSAINYHLLHVRNERKDYLHEQNKIF